MFSLLREVASLEKVETYLIGGYVRDLLLHRNSTDIDCVVIGNGIDFAHKLCDYIQKTENIPTPLSEFKTFGTAMFRYHGKEIELVGARKESYDQNSRKPAVENGSLQDDQNRRDFTINALAISLNKDTYGDVLDPFQGMEDLEHQIIRTPLDPDITFSDDPLRMLRAIRFASQLYFDIEADTFEAISRNAYRVEILSQERISEELNKILLSPKPSYGFKLLKVSGLLPLIFPELAALQGVEVRENKAHKDNFEHTLEVVDNIAYDHGDLWLRWAALLHDIAKPKTKRFESRQGWTFHGHEVLGAKWVPALFKKFRLPLNEKMKYVQKLVSLHLRPIILSEDIVTDSAIRRLLFDAGEDIEDLMRLCKADITSKNREKVARYRNNFALVERKLKEIEEKDKIRNFQPPVTGNEIMEYYHLSPCEEIGIIKTRIKDAILDGDIENKREDAWNLMLKIGKELNLSETHSEEVL
ncbi:MAG: HD domain-containing protein [Bacteroidales bacterium]